LFLAGAGLASFILLRRTYRYLGARSKEEPALARAPRSDAAKERLHGGAPPEMSRWQVELHDLARDLKAEIDSKLSLLQILTAQAQEERQRLEAALARAERLGVSRRHNVLGELEELTSDLADEARWAARSDQNSAPVADEDDADRVLPGSADQRRRAYLLADQGLQASVICDHVGLPQGDVELVLALRS
jgi:hypothetical protein